PDLEKAYPATIGLFAPEPAAGDFDYDAYVRSIHTGARQTLSPEEQIAMANDFLGRVQFEQAKKIAQLRPGPTTSLWLSRIRTDLAEQYPGFDGWVPASVWAQRPSTDHLVAELRQ